MKITSFETDYKDYDKVLKIAEEEIIPKPSLKKDELFEGVNITSERMRSGKFILYEAKNMSSNLKIGVKEIHAYSSLDYEQILKLLQQY